MHLQTVAEREFAFDWSTNTPYYAESMRLQNNLTAVRQQAALEPFIRTSVRTDSFEVDPCYIRD
jgi:hypothetical protein